MAFMDPAYAHELSQKMTNDLSQLGKLFKAKKSAYLEKSVDHNLVEGMIKEGWEEFTKPLKTKTKLRKLKSHDVKFEDDVWCQLYKLGYRHLNFSRDFALPYGKEAADKKQIDVIAVSDDNILIIECKSKEKAGRAPSLKTEFEGLEKRLHGFTKALEQLFGKGRKIKYVFATRNLRLDRDGVDIKRLTDTGSYFYNDNTFEYIEGLIKAYKEAAHYQFQALLFRGKIINKDKIEVPALEGKMGGRTYYMFSIEPHLLLKMGFVLHRTRANDAEMPTYQRLLVPSRLGGIGKFIDDGGYFPNSIVLNFSGTENKLRFEATARGKDSRSRHGILKIPNAYAIAYIIDGQHRVYGYARSGFKDSNTIPVVAFVGLDSTEQLKLFMDINENQKAVSPTLRYTLEEDLYWNSDRTDSRIKALRSSIIKTLGGDISGPLYGKISIGEDKASLTFKPFATALLRSGLLPITKGNQYKDESTKTCLYDTNNLDHNKEMVKARKRVASFLNLAYEFMEKELETREEANEQYIVCNRGTYAFISLLGSLNVHETNLGNLTVRTVAEDRFERIKKYLLVLAESLKNLTPAEKDRILGKLGTGGDILWFKFFQELVNKKYSEYEPADLVDWKERQDKQLQETGRSFGTDIERFLKKTIIEKLKALFGENWDIEIGSIQRQCESRAREQIEKTYKEGLGRPTIHWTEMFGISDYKTIIEKYWSKKPTDAESDFNSFAEVFSIDVGLGFNSKAEKTKWLSRFNSLRNNWAHEGTKEKGLNKEEVQFLKLVYEKLCK